MKPSAMKAVQIFISLAVVISACLELLEIIPGAIRFSTPLVGVLLLLQGIDLLNERRGLAIFSFCCALFIFVVSLVVIFG